MNAASEADSISDPACLASPETGQTGFGFVPLDDLPVSRLYRDYCAGESAIWEFFPTGSSIADSVGRALNTAASRMPDRAGVAAVLQEQNRRWGADDATLRNIGRLAEPGSVCAVTGQQLGLFVSPLYTLYKAATAIRLADLWRSQGHNAVPVFWLADEDHDFDEVAATFLPAVGTLARVGLPVDDTRSPVGRRMLDDRISLVQEALAEALPPAPFRDDVLRHVHETYQPGVCFRDAFARLLNRLLPDSGLILMSGDDARLKHLVAPLFVKEAEGSDLFDRISTRSLELEKPYHAQVKPRDTNLFYLEGHSRLAVDRTADGFAAGALRSWSKEEFRREVLGAPEHFSPNVVLRPLMQDTLLPTAAYVAGPGETAYYAQLGPAYDWSGVPMPAIVPRASLSLVDSRSLRLMTRYGLGLADLFVQPEQLFSRLVRAGLPDDTRAAFEGAAAELDAIADQMKATAEGVDSTLAKSAESARTKIRRQVERMLEKVERAERRKHGELRARLLHAHVLLYPAGGLQERTLSPLYFASRYGMDYFSRLATRLSIDTTEHQVIAEG